MNTTYLLIGSNKGNCKAILAKARYMLTASVGKITSISALYKTEPWGEKNQADFYNQALELSTSLSSRELIMATQRIERFLGKDKLTPYGERTIDIDILLFNNEVINEADLVVPHPRMHQRNFTLIPLAEIADDFQHPVLKLTISDLQHQTGDEGRVERVES